MRLSMVPIAQISAGALSIMKLANLKGALASGSMLTQESDPRDGCVNRGCWLGSFSLKRARRADGYWSARLNRGAEADGGRDGLSLCMRARPLISRHN